MAQPSQRALRAALLAPEHANPHNSRTDKADGGKDIVAMTRALKERIGVLQILDGTACEWPGIHACTDSLADLALEVSQQLQSSRESCEQARSKLRATEAEVSPLRIQLEEGSDALDASEADNSRLAEEQKQLTEQLHACQQSLEQQQSKHEAKCEELRARLAEAEQARAALEAERRKQKDDFEFQEAELQSLKQTAAQQVDELVEVREDLAVKRVDLERQTQSAARSGAELALARRRLQDAAAALAEAQAAAAARHSDVQHGTAALQREQAEVARLRAALEAARLEAARAKQLRSAQVTANLDKLQMCQAAAAEKQHALEAQLAERDTAAAALRAELTAAAASAEERRAALAVQQREAQQREGELRDAQVHARMHEAEAGKLRKALAESQQAQHALQARIAKAEQQSKDLQQSRKVLDERVRAECRRAQEQAQAEARDAQQALAVKASLADSWEREVQATCKRLEQAEKDKTQLQGLNRLLQDQLQAAAVAAPPPRGAQPVHAAAAADAQHTQGAIAELRTEMRALATHLSAQQLGAMAHLSAARSHTYPGGPTALPSPGINWAPVLWSARADGRTAHDRTAHGRTARNRRRVRLSALPNSKGPPAPPAAASGDPPVAMQWAPAQRLDPVSAPASAPSATPVRRGSSGGSARRAVPAAHSAGSAAVGTLTQQERRVGAPLGVAHDVTREAVARQARGRSTARVTPPQRRVVPVRTVRRIGSRQDVRANEGSRKLPQEMQGPFQAVHDGLVAVQDTVVGGPAGRHGSARSMSEQERALEEELERMKDRMKAKAMAGALVAPRTPQAEPVPGCASRKPSAQFANTRGKQRSALVPTVW
eukprot:jgi/Ulvmu1/1357/UM011_0085.1